MQRTPSSGRLRFAPALAQGSHLNSRQVTHDPFPDDGPSGCGARRRDSARTAAAAMDSAHEDGPGHQPAVGIGLGDLAGARFTELETQSFDLVQPYSHEAWRGRVRASAGVGASLDEGTIAAFDAELGALLASAYSNEPLAVPHRVWWVTGRRRK